MLLEEGTADSGGRVVEDEEIQWWRWVLIKFSVIVVGFIHAYSPNVLGGGSIDRYAFS
jgi:hypothetical protein